MLGGWLQDHGVSVLPFLGPERSIGWHSTATSCIAGLTRGTTQAQVLIRLPPSIFYSFCIFLFSVRLSLASCNFSEAISFSIIWNSRVHSNISDDASQR
jgi:hypothetical protein